MIVSRNGKTILERRIHDITFWFLIDWQNK
jgi:hypothetical protein